MSDLRNMMWYHCPGWRGTFECCGDERQARLYCGFGACEIGSSLCQTRGAALPVPPSLLPRYHRDDKLRHHLETEYPAFVVRLLNLNLSKYSDWEVCRQLLVPSTYHIG